MTQRFLKHSDGTVYAWSDALAGLSEMVECDACGNLPATAQDTEPERQAYTGDTLDLETALRGAQSKSELKRIAATAGLVPEEGKSRSVVRMRKLLLDQLK